MSQKESWEAQADFEHALLKGFLSEVASLLSRRPNELLSFDEVKTKLHVREQSYRGLQPVPMAKIVGSVNRYRDFDHRFLPTQTHTKDRWIHIDAIRLRDEELPPVELYKVGDVYFVRDGNHRVSVARERGQEFIDAEVIEYQVRVPLDETVTPEELLLKEEYAAFLEHTGLDRLRPDQHIEVTMLGRYKYLEDHIAVHRYFLGLERQVEVPWDEAVSSWYDRVYMPVVDIIGQRQVLHHFPGLTEADLYLWIMDHRYYLSRECGSDVGAEAATKDFTVRFGQRGLGQQLDKVLRTLSTQVRFWFRSTLHSFGFVDLTLLALVTMWGANPAVVKSVLFEMTPMAFNALRLGGASLFLLILTWISERDLSIARRDWGLVLQLGFIGNFVYQVLFINGLARTRAGNTSLILATTPIFVALIGTLTKSEKLRAWNWIGILLSFLGIFVLITGAGSDIAIGGQTLPGNLLVFSATMAWASYTVLSKRLVQRNSPLKATAWVLASSTPLLILAALPDLIRQDWQAVSLRGWLGLLYSSVLAIAIGYVIWNTGVQRVGSARTSVYSYLTPLVSVAVAWAFLGETMQPVQALGALAVVAGVALARHRAG